MKIGDKVQIRNIGSERWADAIVRGVNKAAAGEDPIIVVAVDAPGHPLHGKMLTVDSMHYQVPKEEKKA